MVKLRYCWREFVEDINKTPNWFTSLRIIGFFLLLFPLLRQNNFPVAFAIFLLLAATDFIDGNLARRKNMVSWLGKGLDPVADKVLLVGTLFAVGFFKVYPILGVILVSLESALFSIGITAFLSKDERLALGANLFGKTKAILEVAVISLIFIDKLHIFYVPNDLILFVFWGAAASASMSIIGHLGMLRGILPEGDMIS